MAGDLERPMTWSGKPVFPPGNRVSLCPQRFLLSSYWAAAGATWWGQSQFARSTSQQNKSAIPVDSCLQRASQSAWCLQSAAKIPSPVTQAEVLGGADGHLFHQENQVAPLTSASWPCFSTVLDLAFQTQFCFTHSVLRSREEGSLLVNPCGDHSPHHQWESAWDHLFLGTPEHQQGRWLTPRTLSTTQTARKKKIKRGI